MITTCMLMKLRPAHSSHSCMQFRRKFDYLNTCTEKSPPPRYAGELRRVAHGSMFSAAWRGASALRAGDGVVYSNLILHKAHPMALERIDALHWGYRSFHGALMPYSHGDSVCSSSGVLQVGQSRNTNTSAAAGRTLGGFAHCEVGLEPRAEEEEYYGCLEGGSSAQPD